MALSLISAAALSTIIPVSGDSNKHAGHTHICSSSDGMLKCAEHVEALLALANSGVSTAAAALNNHTAPSPISKDGIVLGA